MAEDTPDNSARKDPPAPEQIPLLEDVVLEARLMSSRPAKNRHSPRPVITQAKPRSTDLFPEVMVLTGMNPPSDTALQSEAVKMADNLARIYSDEVIRKLRDELTLLLNELEGNSPDSGADSEPKPIS